RARQRHHLRRAGPRRDQGSVATACPNHHREARGSRLRCRRSRLHRDPAADCGSRFAAASDRLDANARPRGVARGDGWRCGQHACVMRRPVAITISAWLFILVGAAGLLKDWLPLLTDASRQLDKLKADGWGDLGPAWTTRLLAIVGGVGLLGGHNWARWLLVAWMVFHIGLSVLHSVPELLTHLVIFAPIGYLLFRPPAESFFVARRPGQASVPNNGGS